MNDFSRADRTSGTHLSYSWHTVDMTQDGPLPGPDGRPRTPWALAHPLLLRYYDREWGLPVRDEQGLFERLSLEAFQAGLSWLTILRKREQFRTAFAHFDPDQVARFGDADVDRLLHDAGIIRNRAKIEATIGNAQAVLRLRADGGLATLIWSFLPSSTPAPRTMAEVPTSSPESVAMSRALRARGFRFVGPTTCFALMEAIGMVDTHLVGSYRRGSSDIWPCAAGNSERR